MPPPSSYIDITSLPFSRTVTQAEFNGSAFGGVNQVWFRYVAASEIILGSCADKSPDETFQPQTKLFEDDGSTQLKSVYPDHAWWHQLDAGTYYIQVINGVDGGDSTYDFTVDFDTAPLNPSIPDNAVIINDDSSGFAGTVFTIDGTFLGFVDSIPASELGDALPSGIKLIHDRFGQYGSAPLALLSESGSLITTVTPSPSLAGSWPRITNDGTRFYVVDPIVGNVWTVSNMGTISSPIATVTHVDQIFAVGVTADGSTLYWSEGYNYNGHAVKAWDLVTDSALPEFYSVADLAADDGLGYIGLTALNEHPGEILRLNDGSFVFWYRDFTDSTDTLLHVDGDGSLLHTYDFDATQEAIDHLSYSPENTDTVRIWFFLNGSDARGRLGELDLSTGTLTTSFETDLFSQGKNKVAGNCTMFGPSSSCTFITQVYQTVSGSPPGSPVEEPTTPPVDISQPCPCPTPGTGDVPAPIGPFPPPIFTCTGGGQVEQVDDLLTLQDCWAPLYVSVPAVPLIIGSPVGSPGPFEEEEPPPSVPPDAPEDVELLA